jgi:hypothetical protein
MPVHFTWHDTLENVARYTFEGAWDWKEFHRVVRVSIFSFYKATALVDTLVDFRGTTLPAGAAGHIRTIGKKQNEYMSGRAVVIGLDAETIRKVGAVDGVYRAGEQVVAFVGDEAGAGDTIRRWREDDKFS